MDIMVDIETTGTDPCHSAVIQISAVAFSINDKRIDPNMFDACLEMPSNRFWQESTRDWWFSNEEMSEVYQGIAQRMRPPAEVMAEFHAWLDGFGGPRLWAKPISFETPFLESYFTQFGYRNPFKYNQSMDLNSYIEARGHNRSRFWKDIAFEGDKHNALFDVIYQIKGAFAA